MGDSSKLVSKDDERVEQVGRMKGRTMKRVKVSEREGS